VGDLHEAVQQQHDMIAGIAFLPEQGPLLELSLDAQAGELGRMS
jgi:hypothetical protein